MIVRWTFLGRNLGFVICFCEICESIKIPKMEYTARQIADLLQGTLEGNPDAVINTFAKIEEGCPGAISFMADMHYEHYLYETLSTVVLVNADFNPTQPVKATLIRVPNAREAIGRLLTIYQQQTQSRRGVHPRAVIAESAQIGKNCYIGPSVYIGEGVVVGDNTQIYANCVIEERSKVGKSCLLYPNVSVYHDCSIGDRIILHSGCCIGTDGFGFAPSADGYEKIPQIGNVIIEDDVEIGANTCVDRAVMGSTIIHKGVKLDNLIQIAHNCEIGANTVMSAQVGIAGSVKVGDWCIFGGQVGIAGHISIADHTNCGAQAGIAGCIRKSHRTLLGSPAMDVKDFARSYAVFKGLPQMRKELTEINEKLESAADCD